MSVLRLAVLCVLAALPSWAARTRIQDTLYKADGTTHTGVIYISWQSFTIPGPALVHAGTIATSVKAGVVDVSLEPLDTAIPAGMTYRVEYRLTGQDVKVEYWSVTTSASPLKIGDVRIIGSPSPPIYIPWSVALGGTGASTAAAARTNLGAAASGANSDVTSLSGLTTALSVGQGGTGASTAAAARTNLGAAASGANSDVTSLSGLTTALSVGQGGTGASTAAGARTSLGVAARGANSDITSLGGLTTPLSSAQGGTGAASPTGVMVGAGTSAMTGFPSSTPFEYFRRGATTYGFSSLPFYVSTDYQYTRTNGTDATADLSATGDKTITLTPCPLGIAPNEKAIQSVTTAETLTVSGATNATPIEITTTGAHGLPTGTIVVIAGVTGNLAANGRWAITSTGATTFTLDGSVGSGAYSAGGTVYREPLITTTTAHGLSSDQFVTISYTAGGSPTINGVWPVTVVDGTSFYLKGVPASGTYTGTAYVSTDNYHYVYISGGTGVAEAPLIKGGTCTAGAASGTIRVTTAQTHTGAWTATSASAGIREAIGACPVNACEIRVPAGIHTLRAPLIVGDGDMYANGGFSRSGVVTRMGIQIIGAGRGGLGDPDESRTDTLLRYVGTDGVAGAVDFRGNWNGGLSNLSINACRYGGSCATIALRLYNMMFGRFEKLTLLNARAGGRALALVAHNNMNTFMDIDCVAQNPNGNPMSISYGAYGEGFTGQYGAGGASRNVFIRMDLWPPAANAVALAIGAADNNSFIELFTRGSTANSVWGVYFARPTSGTMGSYAAFPGENNFFNSPIIGGVNADNGVAGAYGNWFLPYPTGGGQPLPTIAGVAGVSTNGQWFGLSYGHASGADVASAATITPTGKQFRITGTAAINTINLPTPNFEGTICAIPSGAWTTTTAGNIYPASTAVVGRTLCFTYMAISSKWYPSY